MIETRFGERLIEVLNAKGMSQKQLAEMLDFKRQTVNGWCTGGHEPSLAVLYKLCKVLDESSDWLLGLVD